MKPLQKSVRVVEQASSLLDARTRQNRDWQAGSLPHCLCRNLVFSLALLLALGLGCRTATPLPPVDLSAPGWQVRQGQAVWKPSPHRPEIAGELLYALHTNGDCFVQFTKNPMPIVTAASIGDRWQIEFGAHKYFRAGRDPLPERFCEWLQLPRLLAIGIVDGNWRLRAAEDQNDCQVNFITGETLEVRTFP